MATKKRSKGGRAAATRAKSTARPRAAGRKTKATVQPTRAVKTRAAKASKPANVTKTAKAAKPKRTATAQPARTASAESKELLALKNRFQRERSALEKNLTEAVREIGVLRHHEMRVMQLERQLKERDELIGGLQRQLEELQRRPADPIYEREVQQSFALVSPAQDEVDEFEDEVQLVDETQLEDEDA